MTSPKPAPLYTAEDFDNAISDEELENLPFCNPDIKGKGKDHVRIFADRANAIHEERCGWKRATEKIGMDPYLRITELSDKNARQLAAIEFFITGPIAHWARTYNREVHGDFWLLMNTAEDKAPPNRDFLPESN